jgi:hypothetical protein
MQASMVVDRIEGEWAVLEYMGKCFDFPVVLLPEGTKEGSCLELSLVLLPPVETGQSILDRLKAANPAQGPGTIDL